MTANADIKATITADDQASSKLKELGGHLDSVKSSLGNIMTVALGFNLGQIFSDAAQQTKQFVSDSVKAYEENQNALTQMDAALKSTHGAAGLFKQDLIDQAFALENLTPYSHTAIEGVQNLLLTFTQVHGAIYQQAIPAILDVSTAMHEDLQSAAVQVGKALNDPATGMSMLHRIGVTFTQGQMDAAKAMEAAGNMAGAQAIVLQELNKEFGKSAEAAGTTFAGSMAILGNKIDDAKEKFGEVIINGITPFTEGLAKFVSTDTFKKWLDDASNSMDGLIKGFFGFLDAIGKVGVAVGNYLGPKLDALWKSLNVNIIPILVYLWKNVIPPLNDMLGVTLVAAIGLVIDAFTIISNSIGWFVKQLQEGNPIIWSLTTAFIALKAALLISDAITAVQGAFTVLTLVTIPAADLAVSSFAALVASPIVMAAIDVAAPLAAIALVVAEYNSMMNAINQAKAAQEQLDTTTAQLNQHFIAIYNAGQGPVSNDAKAAAARAQAYLHKEGVPGYATGTMNAQGGLSLVGEQGPELVNLPAGSQVMSAQQTQRALTNPNNTTVNINVNAQAFMGSQIQARQFAQQIFTALQDYATSKNTTVAQMVGS